MCKIAAKLFALPNSLNKNVNKRRRKLQKKRKESNILLLHMLKKKKTLFTKTAYANCSSNTNNQERSY